MDKTNGDLSDSSSSDDSSGSRDKIRVGKDYQAVIPDLISPVDQKQALKSTADRALLVWTPTKEISDEQLNEYLQIAKEKYKYNAEQALGMLFWHKYDMERAMSDLSNFQPFPEEWSSHDKMLFEQCFLYSGKNFHKIRQSLPEKTIGSLVKYYYAWKKTRTRISLMDHQVKKICNNNNNHDKGETNTISDVISEHGSHTDSDTDEVVKDDKDNNSGNCKGNKCSNCGIFCTNIHPTSKGGMCKTCMMHFKNTGVLRPTVCSGRGRFDRHGLLKNISTPPRGMYINHDDLLTLASANEVRGNVILRSIDREMATLKRNVQDNRQKISQLKCQVPENIDGYREPDLNGVSRTTSRWSNDEFLLAAQGVRKFGKDFKTISEIIGTKTEAHVKAFFANQKHRYNLDAILMEHEMDNDVATETKMNDDNLSSSTETSEKEDKNVTILDDNSTTVVPSTSLSSSYTTASIL